MTDELNIKNVNAKTLYYKGFEKLEESFDGKLFKARILMETEKGNVFSISLKKPKTVVQTFVSGIPVEKTENCTVGQFLNLDIVKKKT